MYLDFYGLREKPFTLSPNPKFIYYSKSHKEAHAQIVYAMTEKYGYMVISLVVENRHGGKNIHGVPEVTLEKMEGRFSIKLR